MPEQRDPLVRPTEDPLSPECAAALDAALDALQAGRSFDQAALLARHPELGEALGALKQLLAPTTAGNGPMVTPAPRPECVGRYRIERELGTGGFGAVYLAFDPDVRRRVAVKLLHPGRIDQPEAVARFHREARATGRLQHPGIVRLFDYSHQGPPYYLVTEYVEGRDPRRWCKDTGATPAAVADLVARIADAVSYAHQQGVCHRDLKPANVLVDAAGLPHVLDFGLARLQAGENVTVTVPTVEGHVLGSLPYMPPEQASGQSHTADERSDVYSLGVILYELLTGRLPFQVPAHELPARILDGAPPPPRSVCPGVPRDLEAVCLKAMAKRPKDRYQGAAALADDLRAFRDGRPVTARRLTVWGRARRVLDRRHFDTLRQGWGSLLVLLGAVIFAGCAVADHWGRALPAGDAFLAQLATKAAQIALMLLLIVRLRPAPPAPERPSESGKEPAPAMTAAERQIWCLVPGYYGGYLTLVVLNLFLPAGERVPMAPVLAVLSGMGFVSLGATIWGWLYVGGVGFFLLALLIALAAPSYGLTLLGLGWLVCLTVGGVVLRNTR